VDSLHADIKQGCLGEKLGVEAVGEEELPVVHGALARRHVLVAARKAHLHNTQNTPAPDEQKHPCRLQLASQ
jgi:hypothetical protein